MYRSTVWKQAGHVCWYLRCPAPQHAEPWQRRSGCPACILLPVGYAVLQNAVLDGANDCWLVFLGHAPGQRTQA